MVGIGSEKGHLAWGVRFRGRSARAVSAARGLRPLPFAAKSIDTEHIMDAEERIDARYDEARDDYLRRLDRPRDTVRVHHHVTLIWDEDEDAAIEFEELSGDGAICGAVRIPTGPCAFGTAYEVIGATASSAPAGWAHAVGAALAREHDWRSYSGGWRRPMLLVLQATGSAFHVSPSANRASILEHGLDWQLMGPERGIAGSLRPELPVNFLCASRDDVEFFLQMAYVPADVWEADVRGLWLEGDPGASGGGGGNWLLLPEPLSAERLCLLESHPAGRRAS
jgi:hypothetical protein